MPKTFEKLELIVYFFKKERLKLEKEKIRLQELELSQREQELKSASINKQLSHQINAENNSPRKCEVSVKKDDLNALIEKIYTEQNDEDDLSTDGNHKDSGKMSSSYEDSNSPRSASNRTNNKPRQQQQLQNSKSNSIVVTKTSPLVAAAIGNDEEDEFSLMLSENSNRDKIQHHQTSLIDNSIKHQIIKQVSESMDNLKNELLNKGMDKFADDVDAMNKNLEVSKKKADEMERIKREQTLIRKEKVNLQQ